MSITIEEARRKLEQLEQVENDPEMILTKLFGGGVPELNFIYQISMNGQYSMKYLEECLMKIPIFYGCTLGHNAYNFDVYIPALNHEGNKYTWSDHILKIDACEKTFQIDKRTIEDYEREEKAKIEYDKVEIEDYYKRFENLSIKKRIKNIREEIKSERRITIKFSNILFWIFIPKKKVQPVLDREKKRIEEINESNQEFYKRDVERQEYYKKYAPEHIKKIKEKQKEIATYLEGIGYTEK